KNARNCRGRRRKSLGRSVEASEVRRSAPRTRRASMIGKLSVLGFSLVTAWSGSAFAHEGRGSPHPAHGRHAPAAHGGYGPTPVGHDGRWRNRGRGHEAYSARASLDLRYADLDRNGWVSMGEALDSGRQ